MEERKIEEVVEVQGRKFVIKMFPADEGLAILKELITRAIPFNLFSGIAIGGQSISALAETFGVDNSKTQMSIDEFTVFEKRLLRCVRARLKDGDEPIISKEGQYQVVDIEYNMSLVLKLLVEVVRVNYSDFFVEMLEKLKLLKQMTEEQPESL